MQNSRGWKARRDAAEKRQKQAEARYEIRRIRAALVGQDFTDVAVGPMVDEVSRPVVEEPVQDAPEAPEAPEVKVAVKKGGRPKKTAETQDGFIIED